MVQSINPNDPTLVTGTLTVRNVNTGDDGAYSCEALNNQDFIFAIPDAFVEVIGLYVLYKDRQKKYFINLELFLF
jgi:hypothetical protein